MRIFIYPILALCLLSCNNNSNEKQDTNRLLNENPSAQQSQYADKHYLWTVDFDAKKGMQMIRTTAIDKDSLHVANIVSILNNMYPEIFLQPVHQSNDSLFVLIKDSRYLTEQTGSSGAQAYLAEATYDLTEIPGINYVHFSFKAGDHASPDTYTRTDFIKQ